MKKPYKSIHKDYELSGIFILITVVIFLAGFVFIWIYRENVLKIYFAVSLVITILSIALVRYIKYELENFTTEIECIIEKILNDEKLDYSSTYQDKLFSKIFSKLIKVYETNNLKSKKIEEEKNQVNELISDISHQIKTPFANVKMYNQLLLGSCDTYSESYTYLNIMNNQINKIDFLIQGLIKLSRLETNIIVLKIGYNFVIDLLASALTNVMIKAEKKNIQLISTCNSDIKAYFDLKWTTEVVFNILDNAIKYSKENSEIRINVSELEDYVRIEIIDKGPGIKEDTISLIFNRFYRGSDVHNIDGLGLGLNLARKIITKEQGYIQVRSKVGYGSNFAVHLLKSKSSFNLLQNCDNKIPNCDKNEISAV